MVSVGGIVLLSRINSGQTAPGPQTSAAPGTDPGDGDTATGGQGQPVDGVSCDRGEQLAFHVHAHVFILKDGTRQPVSASIGIPGAPLPRCFYWLHTHDRTGAIHMEAPGQRTFTLGQFFDIWGQPLTSSRVALVDVPAGQFAVFVDGHPYTGDPREAQLKAHTQVVIEIGKQVTPPTFEFGGL
ncbi:MAG TPA: hypothetical protein VGR61_02840 [Candidatus Dormibacteraeota bacterium]|nr:hypothetical protein [Candidatus Dormibacteraeota bacterium]